MQDKLVKTLRTNLLAPKLEGLKPYQPQRFKKHVDLRLDGNEGSHPPVDLLDSLSPLGSDLMRRYPDASQLEACITEKLRVYPGQVLVTAGADDALYRVCRACLAPGSQLILPEPTFEMIGRYARLARAEIISIPWLKGPYPINDVIDKVGPKTAMIGVVSPNNPTGSVATIDDLELLSKNAPNAILLVDQAYTEFADYDLTPKALSLPNSVVIRSLSKAWGLAGLRVGYAVGDVAIINNLRAVGQPYAVSGPSLALARLRIMEAHEEVKAFVKRIKQERNDLTESLIEMGIEVLPTQANFVLARFDDAKFIKDALSAMGIAVRIFPSEPSLHGWLRISCPGNRESFDRLQDALQTILVPEALLLDLDGVLADVSQSYRLTISVTAKSYGVILDPEEISAAKTQPGSNNDWVLTHRLLEHHGMRVSLDEVTKRFEDLYQGTKNQPGFRQSERLLIKRDLLDRLSRRLPLAVVTGRPRIDALRFLDQEKISSFIKILICMEDAPAKPDPAPVRLAMSKLGIRHAWMVGDMPDDIRAARAARVLPFGISISEGKTGSFRKTLSDQGAVRILENLEYLEDMLP